MIFMNKHHVLRVFNECLGLVEFFGSFVKPFVVIVVVVLKVF